MTIGPMILEVLYHKTKSVVRCRVKKTEARQS
jgi:hypothetical protein